MLNNKQFNHRRHALVHAPQRARQRYGVSLDAMDFEGIRNQIHRGEAMLLDDQVLKAIYKVVVRGTEMRVVYNTVNRRVVTVLPIDPPKNAGNAERSQFFTKRAPEVPMDTDFWAHTLVAA